MAEFDDKKALLDEVSAMSDEELSQLSDDELSYIEQITDEMESSQAGTINKPISPGDAALSKGLKAEDENRGIVSSTLETAADAAVSFANQIPGIKALGSAIGAGIEVATGQSKSFTEAYDENLDFRKRDQEIREERSPIITTGAKIVSEVGQTVATGGVLAGTKALAGVAKVAPTVAKMAAGIGADFLVGTAQRIDESELKTMETLVKSAEGAALWSIGTGAVGFGLGRAASGAGKLIRKGSRALGVTDALENSLIKENLLNNSRRLVANMNKFTQKAGIDDTRYLKVLKKAGLGAREAVEDGKIAIEKLDSAVEKTGSNIRKSYKALVDSGFDAVDNIDAQDIVKEMEFVLDDMVKQTGGDPSSLVLRKADEIRSLLMDTVTDPNSGLEYTVPKQLNIHDLWNVRKEMYKKIPKSGVNKDSLEGIAKSINSKFNQALDDIIATGDETAKGLVEGLKRQNMDFRILQNAQEIAKKGNLIANEPSSITGALIKSTIELSPIAGLKEVRKKAMAMGLDPLSKRGQDIIEELSSIEKFGNFLEGTSGKSATMGMYVSKLTTLAADEEASANQIDKVVKQGMDIASFVEAPMSRTAEGFEARSAQFINAVSSINPDIADQLTDMISKGEDVGPVMDQLSKLPEAREVIEPGIGWNGRVYSPEDKAALEAEIKALPPTVPTVQRAQMIKDLRSNGTIPDLGQVQPRRPKKSTRKSKNRY